jgi:SET domain-containing protein
MANIKTYRSPKTEVRSSPLGGRGLFAREEIFEGEVVAVKAGHILRAEEVFEVTKSVGDYTLQIHDDFFLGPRLPEEIEDVVIFINHSCDPNVGFGGQITYVAMRNVNAGEELCHDYAMERTLKYELKCLCGSDMCRGTVTSEDWKREDLQKRYGNYFSSYILRKIELLER